MSLDWFEQQLREHTPGEWRGEMMSLLRGSGLDISDFTQYVPGDSPRNINRKLSAKHDTLWVNNRHDEGDVSIHLFFDTNANRLAGVHQSNRDMVWSWMKDFLLLVEQYHLRHVEVSYAVGGAWKDVGVVRSSQQRYSCIQEVRTEIQLSRSSSSYTSGLSARGAHQQSGGKKKIYVLFSDFFDTSSSCIDAITVLEAWHRVARVVLETTRVRGKNTIAYV